MILGSNPIEEIIVQTQSSTHTITLPNPEMANDKIINQELEIVQSTQDITSNNSSLRESSITNTFIMPNLKLSKITNDSSDCVKTEAEVLAKDESSNFVRISNSVEISTSDEDKTETRFVNS